MEVYGDKSHFSFRTLAEVKVQGEVKGRFGFVQGEEILRQVVLHSNLEIIDEPGAGYYYVRKGSIMHASNPLCGEHRRALSAEGAFLLD